MRKAKTIIHVNRKNMAHNTKHGTNRPIFTVKMGKTNLYGHRVLVDGPVEFVYSPHNPLSCGARAWAQTYANVEVL